MIPSNAPRVNPEFEINIRIHAQFNIYLTRKSIAIWAVIWYNLFCSRANENIIWGISTVGSALHSHCRGQEFESPMLHQQDPFGNIISERIFCACAAKNNHSSSKSPLISSYWVSRCRKWNAQLLFNKHGLDFFLIIIQNTKRRRKQSPVDFVFFHFPEILKFLSLHVAYRSLFQ